MRKDSRCKSGDPNRRHHLWMIALTAVVAALLVHNAINGGPGQGSRTRCALRVHTEPIMMNQRRMLTRTRCGGDQAPESGGMGSDCHAAVRIVIFSILALPRITSLMACTIHWPTRPLDTRFRGSFRAS